MSGYPSVKKGPPLSLLLSEKSMCVRDEQTFISFDLLNVIFTIRYQSLSIYQFRAYCWCMKLVVSYIKTFYLFDYVVEFRRAIPHNIREKTQLPKSIYNSRLPSNIPSLISYGFFFEHFYVDFVESFIFVIYFGFRYTGLDMIAVFRCECPL